MITCYAFGFEGGKGDFTWGTPALRMENGVTVLNPTTGSISNYEECLEYIERGYLTKLPFEVKVNLKSIERKAIIALLSRGEKPLFVRRTIDRCVAAITLATKKVDDCAIDIFYYENFKLFANKRCNQIFDILVQVFDDEMLDTALILDAFHPKLLALRSSKKGEWERDVAEAMLSNKPEKLKIYKKTLEKLKK